MNEFSKLSETEKLRVERPIINPYFRFCCLDGHYFMESPTGIIPMENNLAAKILKKIDGKKTIADLVRIINESELAIKGLLIRMANLGYIVSNDHKLSPEFVAYWQNFRVSPRRSAEALQENSLYAKFLGRRFPLQFFKKLGFQWQKQPEQASMIVIFTDDYLHQQLPQLTAEYRAMGKRVILINPYNVEFMMGPIFNPAGQAGCYECLKIRMESHQEMKFFIKNSKTKILKSNITQQWGAHNDEFLHYIADFLGQYIMNNNNDLNHNMLLRNIFDNQFHWHRFTARPQCHCCGVVPSELQPIKIESAPKLFASSGGFRKISPQQTFDNYKHLISPYTGIIRYLKPEINVNNGYFYVYSSGQNQALRTKHFTAVRDSMRAQTFGKGMTELDAKVSSMCEALERASAVFLGDEIRQTARMTDFKDGQAIDPNDIMLFSDWQYENRTFLNNLGYRFLYVPHRFRPDESMEWSPIWSMMENRWKYLPSNYLYFTYPVEGEAQLTSTPDSNGMASGSCFEDAVVQGFYELIERDSFAQWWYNKLSLPQLDLSSFDNPFLHNAPAEYAKFNREIWLIDITADFGIPAFAALSRRIDKNKQDIIIGAGAHEDCELAAIRALAECNQSLPGYSNFTDNEADYVGIDWELKHWFFHVTLENNNYLRPNPNAPKTTKNTYKSPQRPDFKDDIEYFINILQQKNLELLIKDLTRPDIKMPVAQVKVPGLRHFWSRLKPGRLFDVPVQMGRLAQPTAPEHINPIPVFI